jgi:peptidyl-prolyl cis-trans isomerase A (cyclophilin A)
MKKIVIGRTVSPPVLVMLLFSLFQAGSVMAETIDILMETSAGEIRLELYPEAAPVTVANFLKYVDHQHYDGKASFYRTVRMDNQAQNNIKIEVIQGGMGMEDPDPPLQAIAHETTNDSGILHLDGVISMGRLDPGSATTEFFICVNDQPGLDFGGKRLPDGLGFASFGKVISGMDVVRRIQAMNTDMPDGQELEYTRGQILTEPVLIQKISRIGNH